MRASFQFPHSFDFGQSEGAFPLLSLFCAFSLGHARFGTCIFEATCAVWSRPLSAEILGFRVATCRLDVRVAELAKDAQNSKGVAYMYEYGSLICLRSCWGGSSWSHLFLELAPCLNNSVWVSLSVPNLSESPGHHNAWPSGHNSWVNGRRGGTTSCWVLCYTILYYTILYYTILYYILLYYTILYYTILYYTILYYTILYHKLRGNPVVRDELRRQDAKPAKLAHWRSMARGDPRKHRHRGHVGGRGFLNCFKEILSRCKGLHSHFSWLESSKRRPGSGTK